MAQVRFAAHCIEVAPGETVLDAFLRRGVDLPFSCRKGSCHTCLLRVVEGSAPVAAQRGLSAVQRERNYLLPCLCRPEHDLVLAAPAPEDCEIDVVVVGKRVVAPDVCVLRLDPGRTFSLRPGQHVEVMHPTGERRAYSVANLPEAEYEIELHVRRIDGGRVSTWLHDTIGPGDALRLRGPLGDFVHDAAATDGSLLLLGTGTGAAPLLAIATDALRRGQRGDIHFFHGVRKREALYLDGTLRALAARHPQFHYHACVSRDPTAEASVLQGRVGDAAIATLGPLGAYRTYIAGAADIVQALAGQCRDAGAHDIRTDAFASPRVGQAPPTDPAATNAVEPGADPALWRALGEGALLHAVLVDFYAEIFADERLGPYFRGVTRQRLVEKQYSFLRSLITGTREYFGQRPRNAHHWMVVSDELFDYRLAIMDKWMRHHGLQEPWIGRWHAYENRFRADIVKSQPIARDIGGVAVVQKGFLEDVLAIGTICDACNDPIEPGERVRYHARLGTTYCRGCANR